MKRIRIAYVIDQLNIGGTEKQLLAVIERLDRDRFEPYLVCLRESDHLRECSVNCRKTVLNVPSLFSIHGFKKLKSFSNHLKKEQIDIVQTFFFDSTVFGVLAARLAGVQRILSSRRDMGFWYTPSLLCTLFFVNLLTHRIVVNSEAIKINVHKWEHVRKDKIDVIYNGIDLEPFSCDSDTLGLKQELKIPENDHVVGIVANLNRQVKRVDLFIDAAAQILINKENVSFLVVGEGGLRKKLEKQSEDLGITNKIHFVGSKGDVVKYMKIFDVGVLTSESEGFSNSIIEYMASGLPVVGFGGGGNEELVVNGKNGFLSREISKYEISRFIIDLINDPSLSDTISMNNRESVTKYSWKSISKVYNDYLVGLLG